MTSETPAIPPGAQRLAEMTRRIPVNGTFELTVRCNLHCKMCLFRHADSENARLLAEEIGGRVDRDGAPGGPGRDGEPADHRR